MIYMKFPKISKHNYVHGKKGDLGDRLSDLLSKYAGSWLFIIAFILFGSGWVIMNGMQKANAFDPFPFILLNLGLSLLAAIQAPVILMSQNRQGEKDRKRSELDYIIDKKAEREVVDMQKDLEIIKSKLDRLIKK